jgi:hypothetical protein
MSIDGLPHTDSESYLPSMLEFAERLDYPALAVAGTLIAGGRNVWVGFVAKADREQLVQALGVMIAKVHRERKA